MKIVNSNVQHYFNLIAQAAAFSSRESALSFQVVWAFAHNQFLRYVFLVPRLRRRHFAALELMMIDNYDHQA
jgi:hypothetical protein